MDETNPVEQKCQTDSKDNHVKVGDTVVFLDPNCLKFNEITLSKFLQEAAGWYNYYGQRLADSEAFMQILDARYDVEYARVFSTCKESGETEKLADSHAKMHPEVDKAKRNAIAGKRISKKIQQFLRALDKAHENAHNFGYNLRKEMDKHSLRIRESQDAALSEGIDNVIKAAELP
jgi:hypothetical protein